MIQPDAPPRTKSQREFARHVRNRALMILVFSFYTGIMVGMEITDIKSNGWDLSHLRFCAVAVWLAFIALGLALKPWESW